MGVIEENVTRRRHEVSWETNGNKILMVRHPINGSVERREGWSVFVDSCT